MPFLAPAVLGVGGRGRVELGLEFCWGERDRWIRLTTLLSPFPDGCEVPSTLEQSVLMVSVGIFLLFIFVFYDLVAAMKCVCFICLIS